MKKKYRNRLQKGAEVTGFNAYVENGEIIVEVELKDKFLPKDGDFLIDADGDIFIYSDAKTQNSNFYSCHCGTHHGKIRAAFCYNWVDKNGCRFATPEEKSAFIIRLEKEYHLRWNAETKNLEPTRWKPKNGEKFYYIGVDGVIKSVICHGFMDFFDDYPNCFKTEESAKLYAEEMKELLKRSKAE